MGNLKSELEGKNKMVKYCKFLLEITVNDVKVETTPFHIVSSYSQLPSNWKDQRRSREKNTDPNPV